MAVPGEGPAARADLVRASDSDRDRVIAELSDWFAEGRLSHDTFAARLDAAMHAKAQGELRGLLVDLPRPRRLGAAVRAACAGAVRKTVGAVDLVDPPGARAVAAAERAAAAVHHRPRARV